MPEQNTNEIIESILRRAATDGDFRANLLKDPTAATASFASGTVPAHLNIKFVEKPKEVDAIYVLPPFSPRGELSDSELEAVAGGDCDYDTDGEDGNCMWTCVISCWNSHKGGDAI